MKQEIPDLDEIIDRTEVPTLKFDGETMESIFGASDLWPSWVADMDFRASPKIIEALSRRLEHGIFGYENTSEKLPAAVSDWYRSRHGWSFASDEILFTPRTLNSLAVLIKLFSAEGDGVIVQPPVFYDFKMIIHAHGRRLVKNPLRFEQGGYEIDFDHLEQVAAAAHNRILILCNPHNPIGRVWSKSDLLRLSEICAANGVFVIADEIHGDITYGATYTPLASVSETSRLNCATCISPVKSFNLAGVANSMIVIGDEARRQPCRDWYSRNEINKNNVFTTAAMLAAYTEGAPWLERVNAYLAENVDALRDFLQQKIPTVALVQPRGTFLVWLDLRGLGLDARQLEQFLAGPARMATNPGHWFGREGAGFARINIACPRSSLLRALRQLEKAVSELVV